jgi:copper(I)-binding protein
MRSPIVALLTVLLLAVAAVVTAAQRTVTASAGWVKAPVAGSTEAAAFVTVENGTMYEVYLVGAESDVAGIVELRQASKSGGAPIVTKEVGVPAFDRLDMAPDGVYIHLGELKRPLKAGETVSLAILVDNGPPLTVAAVVK